MKKIFIISAILTIFCLSANAQQKVYNFNDGSWGTSITERPESGTYTSSTVNDVKLNSSVLYQKDGKGSTRVIMDKKSTQSSIEFPPFTNMTSVIVDASVGTEGRTMVVEQKVNNKWQAIGEPIELTKQKTAYSFELSPKATQFRILNPTTSTLTVFKVTIK